MEVRLIDSESHHHAGKIVGSPLKTISSNNRTTHKFSESHDHPAPFSYLIMRALNPNPTRGKTSGPKGFSREQGCLSDSPQRSIGLRDDAGSQHHAGRTRTDSRDVIPPSIAPGQSAPSSPAPFSYLRLKTLESPHHAGTTEQEDGNAGNQTVVRLHPVIPSDRASPTFYFGCPALFLPSSGPHSILESQNADGTARSHFLLSSKQISPVQNGSARTLPHRPSAPNSSDQNAGHSNGHSPPRLIGLKPKLLARSPCAQFIQTGVIGMGKSASPFRRFLSYLWGKSAFSDESKEMTNFGWRKKA